MALPEQIIGKLEQLIYQREEISRSNQLQIQQSIAELALTAEPVSLAELHVLQCIGHHPDFNVISISKVMKMTRGAISKICARLERKGLVIKQQVPANQKEVCFTLTPIGYTLWELHEEGHQKPVQQLVQLLSKYRPDELEVIERFLDDLVNRTV